MTDVEMIVDEYFTKHPVDIEQVKINFKERNEFKILDDTTGETFDLGVNLAKLYIEQN
jgi:hypothetical protein